MTLDRTEILDFLGGDIATPYQVTMWWHRELIIYL